MPARNASKMRLRHSRHDFKCLAPVLAAILLAAGCTDAYKRAEPATEPGGQADRHASPETGSVAGPNLQSILESAAAGSLGKAVDEALAVLIDQPRSVAQAEVRAALANVFEQAGLKCISLIAARLGRPSKPAGIEPQTLMRQAIDDLRGLLAREPSAKGGIAGPGDWDSVMRKALCTANELLTHRYDGNDNERHESALAEYIQLVSGDRQHILEKRPALAILVNDLVLSQVRPVIAPKIQDWASLELQQPRPSNEPLYAGIIELERFQARLLRQWVRSRPAGESAALHSVIDDVRRATSTRIVDRIEIEAYEDYLGTSPAPPSAQMTIALLLDCYAGRNLFVPAQELLKTRIARCENNRDRLRLKLDYARLLLSQERYEDAYLELVELGGKSLNREDLNRTGFLIAVCEHFLGREDLSRRRMQALVKENADSPVSKLCRDWLDRKEPWIESPI